MWFKLQIEKDRPSVAILINHKGEVFFRAIDLGKFLMFANVYAFARRTSRIKVWDVVPDCLPKSVNNCRLLTMFQAFKTVQRSRRYDAFTFIDILKKGQLTDFPVDRPILYHLDQAPKLEILRSEDDGTLSYHHDAFYLSQWVENFTKRIKKHFDDGRTWSVRQNRIRKDYSGQDVVNSIEKFLKKKFGIKVETARVPVPAPGVSVSIILPGANLSQLGRFPQTSPPALNNGPPECSSNSGYSPVSPCPPECSSNSGYSPVSPCPSENSSNSEYSPVSPCPSENSSNSGYSPCLSDSSHSEECDSSYAPENSSDALMATEVSSVIKK